MKEFLILVLVLAGIAFADETDQRFKEALKNQNGQAINQNTANLDKRHKKIDAHFGGTKEDRANDATMQAYDNRVAMEYDRQKKAHVGADRGLAKADIDGKHQAAAIGYGESGGSAVAGKEHGKMRLNKDASGQEHADFTGRGIKEIQTQVERDNRGEIDKFQANGEKLQAKIDPVVSSKSAQEGGLFFKDDKKGKDEYWLYEIDNSNKNDVGAVISEQGEGKGSNVDQSFLSRLLGQKGQKKYTCKARKVGESLCVDQNGKTVGKTVATDDGNVVVYNKHNVPVARGKVKKISKTQYVVNVNEGLMTASTSDIKYYDCMREMGKAPSDKVKLMKPLHFKYNSEDATDGSVSYKFPDCMEVGGRVQLAKGVDASRLATEYVVNLLPIGRLRCMDPGTCGRQCYYCDYCGNKHKLDMLGNSAGNVCDAKGGSTVDMVATICPPSETFNYALCSKFDKSLLSQDKDDYWKKKGDVDVQMRFYLRPQNREQLIANFQKETTAFGLGAITKAALKAEYFASKGIKNLSLKVTDSELLEFYLQKKDKDELIGCQRAVIKYNLGGSKVDGSFLIEAASQAGGVPSIFEQKPCKEWTKLDQEQYNIDMEVAKEANKQSGGGGLFGGLFGGN